MNGRINNVVMRMLMLFCLVANLAAYAAAQAINLDFDVGTGDPEQGNGAPSSSFGAAAGQLGFWNRVGFGANPVELLGTDGQLTPVLMTANSTGGYFGTGFRNKANTGDFALLLNDAVQLGALGPGGNKTYTFTGLETGLYLVYTYAVGPSGFAVDTPVHIAEATHNQTQIVTGPMPGNAFDYLVTHSIHEVQVGLSGFAININQPPGLSNPMSINGLQIAPVPEPISIITIATFCSLLIIRQRSRY